MPPGVEPGLVEAANRRVAKVLRKVASEQVIQPDILGMMPPASLYDVVVLLHAIADKLEAGTEGEDHDGR